MGARGGRVGEGRRESGHPSATVHRPPALIREFNCQPYESEPIIDSTRTCLSLYRAKPPSGLHVLRLHPFSCRPLQSSPVVAFALFRLSLTFVLPPRTLSVLEIKTHRGVLKLMHLFLSHTYILVCVIELAG